MSASEVVIVRTGTANVASVIAALRRIGASPRLSAAAADVRDARALVLPGVGAFGPAMEELHATGFVGVLRERIERGAPTLAICLGLQLLARASEESPGVSGLGVIDATVTRLTGNVRVPHIGWNGVEVAESGAIDAILKDGYAYYANSFCLAGSCACDGWRLARTTHGAPFIGAIERGSVVACQFHPELSGPWGLSLMRRWLERAGVALACTEGVPC